MLKLWGTQLLKTTLEKGSLEKGLEGKDNTHHPTWRWCRIPKQRFHFDLELGTST